MNISKSGKILLFVFIVLFFVFLGLYIKNAMGLFFDFPIMTVNALSYAHYHDGFLFDYENRARFATNFLVAIPFNLISIFFSKHFLLSYLKAFTSSYFIVIFFSGLFAYFVGKRTKRLDITVILFAIFCLFTIPNFIWICREIHIAMFYHFMLFAYFMSETKLTKRDFIPITLILLYSFESFESVIPVAALLFSYYCYCEFKKDTHNIGYKRYIGITCLLILIYMCLRLFSLNTSNGMDCSGAFMQVLNGTYITVTHLFYDNLIFSVIAFLLIVCAIFIKKPFGVMSLGFFIPFLIAVLLLYGKFIGWDLTPNINLHYYSLILWLFPPVLLTLIIFDIKGIKIRGDFIHNLFVISCVCGIIQLSLQINSALQFKHYLEYMQNRLETSNERVIVLKPEEFSPSYMKFATCYGTAHLSLFLTEEYKKTKVFIPDLEFWQTPSCDESMKQTKISEDGELIIVQDAWLKRQNDYWDVTGWEDIVLDYYEKHNKSSN